MTQSSQPNIDHIRLDAQDRDRHVFITGDNEDRFILPVPDAVRHIQVGESRAVWNDELNALLSSVYRWVRGDVHDRVAGCYAAPCDGVITIFVVPASGRFDFDLADKISELGLSLARNFQLVPTDALQIPGKDKEQLSRFVDLRIAIDLYTDE